MSMAESIKLAAQQNEARLRAFDQAVGMVMTVQRYLDDPDYIVFDEQNKIIKSGARFNIADLEDTQEGEHFKWKSISLKTDGFNCTYCSDDGDDGEPQAFVDQLKQYKALKSNEALIFKDE